LLHESFFRSAAKLTYLLSLLLLIGVLIFGENIRGTKGWFQIFSFSFQPAELAKVGLILFLAWWIEKQSRRFDRWQFILTSGFFTILLVALILLQPDLGSAIVLTSLWFGMLCLTGVKKRHLVFLVLIFAVAATTSWFCILQDYQKQRLITFVNPAYDQLGAGYNVRQSVIAIGAGQLWGRGLGFGSQSQLHFLPEAQTDFVFAVVAEELGFLGASMLLIIYFLLLWRLLAAAKRANSDFSAFTLIGIILLFFIQTLINIGGASAFLPITGVTLPFVSYGGSSLVINFLLLGIAESIIRARA
jgi:rod shape determining protein RodA